MRAWNCWKSKCSSGSKTETFLLRCQPTIEGDQASNLFSGQSRFLEIRLLWETFQLQQITKREKNLGIFHLGTPKTAFLMRNSPTDTLILGIYPNNQGHSFQFQKNSRGGLPFLQLHLQICLIQLHVDS